MRARVVDAVVLAGGASSRMGGVDKPLLTIGASTLLDIALDATDFCRRTVVVGSADLSAVIDRRLGRDRIDLTREDPPRSGPVHALAAGMRLLRARADVPADAVVVLAADLPAITAEDLISLADTVIDKGVDVVIAEHDGIAQPLVAAWRPLPLTVAIDALGDTRHRAVRELPTGKPRLAMPNAVDCDTPEALAGARAALPPDSTDVAAILRDALPTLPTRALPPVAAIGAALAEPLIGAEPFPAVDRSAMDGYAVRGDPPWRIRVGVQRAGDPGSVLSQPGTAIRITTGAVVPDGADAVHRDEFLEVAGDRLSPAPTAPSRNDIRRRGEDWPAGSELAAAGRPVTPALASVALSAERDTLVVRGPVRARVVVTGNEIRRGPVGSSHLTTDSIGPVLPAFLATIGIVVETVDYVDDEDPGRILPHPTASHPTTSHPTAFHPAVSHSAGPDLTVVVGATGFGVRDGLRPALREAGATVLVDRVRVRPGGSQVVARLPDGHLVLGLPGNPYAAVVTALWTGSAIAAAMTGLPLRRRRGLLAAGRTPEVPTGTDRLLPATIDRDGAWRVAPSVRTATLAGLAEADAVAAVRFGRRDIELIDLPR